MFQDADNQKIEKKKVLSDRPRILSAPLVQVLAYISQEAILIFIFILIYITT